MSRIDLHTFSSEQEFQSDLCIVGGGIAGLVLADALRGSGRRVDLLEAGGAEDESESQVLYAAEMAGVPHLGTTQGRFRVYGGSSTRWGGQLLPLATNDFKIRAHVPGSGWPLDPAELSPYLHTCESLLGTNHAPFDSELIDQLPNPGPQPSDPDLQPRFSKWAPFSSRNVAVTLGRRCEDDPHTRVFLHAAVTGLRLDGDGRNIHALEVRTLAGRQFRFTARQVVIAAGTIETTRLLLVSGIGNDSDQLGRWFHDHLSIQAATLHPQPRKALLQRFAPWFIGATRHTLKLESTAEWQARQGCLNVMGHLVFEAPDTSGFAWLRQQLQARQRREVQPPAVPAPYIEKLPAESLDLLYLAWKATVRRRRWCPAGAAITLYIDTEQQPNPESRIRISPHLDALGMPKAIVDWRWGDKERYSFACYQQLFDRQWQSWNLGAIDWHQSFEPGSGWEANVSDIYHLMGGTRMAADPRSGVVNAKLRVHGIENLFVASCSVFPTGGSSNPTLTLMQLSLRLAKQLRRF
ncbi:GMC family oxidoreductase [Synechococcus sp. CS-1325]|uniref:GMC oxidoreductase n=1 Tax=unclassified Synechococcus TaxID=2626047 RepID=UPI0021A8C7D3|nr:MULTISPECIES: GMC family oxidoreductase [unclassified Synechococcus]MCT0200800.1 GMC family oxidoreductase [Synechococcus sp. CS-1325]MCT0213839.1 GMC family oxidoreductase [Synechococcus sp. CS-1326]MCT0233415.1 GMC family oxidoreductase [Synechococcus sp. CS-1327]